MRDVTLGCFKAFYGVEPPQRQYQYVSTIDIQANPTFFKQKIVHKVLDSVLVVFTKCENAGIESFFIFLKAK